MALIKCPECRKKISDKAEACPNCGYPFPAGDKDVISKDIPQEAVSRYQSISPEPEEERKRKPKQASGLDTKTISCENCGAEIEEDLVTCFKCGSRNRDGKSLPARKFKPSGPQVRPWVRFWARTTDDILFGVLCGTILVFTFPEVLAMNEVLLGMLLAFIFIFFEAAMLSTWGTTPGKALLNVCLRKKNGMKPYYGEALTRAFNVWFRGEGLGIPLILLFTRMHAHGKLTKEGITSWDRDGEFTVVHKKVGVVRIIAAIVIFMGFFFLIGTR